MKSVSTLISHPERFKALCADLFDLVGKGVLRTVATRTYALKDAAQAHRDAERAEYAGPVVFIP